MNTKAENRRTVAHLLTIRPHGLLNTLWHIKSMNKPMHLYVYCRSTAIAKRFLANAEREGSKTCVNVRMGLSRIQLPLRRIMGITISTWMIFLIFMMRYFALQRRTRSR